MISGAEWGAVLDYRDTKEQEARANLNLNIFNLGSANANVVNTAGENALRVADAECDKVIVKRRSLCLKRVCGPPNAAALGLAYLGRVNKLSIWGDKIFSVSAKILSVPLSVLAIYPIDDLIKHNSKRLLGFGIGPLSSGLSFSDYLDIYIVKSAIITSLALSSLGMTIGFGINRLGNCITRRAIARAAQAQNG